MAKPDDRDRVSRDGCCVPTDALCGLVRDFVKDWYRDRPSTAGSFAACGERVELTPVEPLAWLSAESGVSKAALEKIRQATPENIKKGRRHALTEFTIADRIVTALDRPEVFHDGTLPVVPNRLATVESRAQYGGDLDPGERRTLIGDGVAMISLVESRLELPGGSLTGGLVQ